MPLPPKPPQPKPIGPAKGGPPPRFTKEPKSIGPLVTRGERTGEGHAEAHHKRVGQTPSPNTPANKQNIAARAEHDDKVRTAPGSGADWTRYKRIIEKSSEYRSKLKQVAAGVVGTTRRVDLELPGPPNKAPTMQVATPVPGGKPAITTARARVLCVELKKTNNGIIVKTFFGKP